MISRRKRKGEGEAEEARTAGMPVSAETPAWAGGRVWSSNVSSLPWPGWSARVGWHGQSGRGGPVCAVYGPAVGSDGDGVEESGSRAVQERGSIDAEVPERASPHRS